MAFRPLTAADPEPTLPEDFNAVLEDPMPHRLFLLGCRVGAVLCLGCTNPSVALEKFRVLEMDTLGFLRDGQTTRQEILTHLGTPSARFEGDRILTYDFVRNTLGDWRRVGTTVVSDWRFTYGPSSCSLVLVFQADGLLARHTLVKDQEWPLPSSASEREVPAQDTP
jgi:hypothetical protein